MTICSRCCSKETETRSGVRRLASTATSAQSGDWKNWCLYLGWGASSPAPSVLSSAAAPEAAREAGRGLGPADKSAGGPSCDRQSVGAAWLVRLTHRHASACKGMHTCCGQRRCTCDLGYALRCMLWQARCCRRWDGSCQGRLTGPPCFSSSPGLPGMIHWLWHRV